MLSRYVLPVEPNVQKLVHVFYTQPSFIAPYAKVGRYASYMMLMHDGRYNNNRLPAGPMEYDDEKDDFPAHLRIYGAI